MNHIDRKYPETHYYGGNKTPDVPRALDYYMRDEDLHRFVHAVTKGNVEPIIQNKTFLKKIFQNRHNTKNGFSYGKSVLGTPLGCPLPDYSSSVE